MKNFNFTFAETDYIVDTFYCIKEIGEEQYRYLVEIVEEIGTSEKSELVYEAWIRGTDERTSKMLLWLFQKDISKHDFIELVKQAIKTGF